MMLFSRALMLVMLTLTSVAVAAAQSAEESAGPTFAHGTDASVVYYSERDTPTLELAVAGIEQAWQGPAGMFPPDPGMEYIFIEFSVTNLTSDVVLFSPFSLELIDSLGFRVEQAWVMDDADGVWIDDVEVEAGGTAEGALVFMIHSDTEPMMVLFQPEWNSMTFIYLAD